LGRIGRFKKIKYTHYNFNLLIYNIIAFLPELTHYFIILGFHSIIGKVALALASPFNFGLELVLVISPNAPLRQIITRNLGKRKEKNLTIYLNI